MIWLAASLFGLSTLAGCDSNGQVGPVARRIVLDVSVRDDGTAMQSWADGIAISIGEAAAARLIDESIPLSAPAQAWLDVLESALPQVNSRALQVAGSFGLAPIDATVVVGNRGSSDGFGWVPDRIGINVQAFVDTYGTPGEGATERMVRIIAHEYLHLLTYAHYPNHRDLRQTPLDRALWTIFFEGIGDYVSVSRRWLPDDSGGYSPVAAETITRLEPILVDRLERFVTADAGAEPELRERISMGRFDEKWGSLSYALWLRRETVMCGEGPTLRRVIELERDSVLPLALRHADPAYRKRLRSIAERTGAAIPDFDPGACLVAFEFD